MSGVSDLTCYVNREVSRNVGLAASRRYAYRYLLYMIFVSRRGLGIASIGVAGYGYGSCCFSCALIMKKKFFSTSSELFSNFLSREEHANPCHFGTDSDPRIPTFDKRNRILLFSSVTFKKAKKIIFFSIKGLTFSVQVSL